MAIEIDNDYALYQVTDTLHQLVDRLNLNQDKVDANTRLLDSALNDHLEIYRPSSILSDSNFTVTCADFTIDADSDFIVTADRYVNVSAADNLYIKSDTKSVIVGTGGPVPALLLRDEGAGTLFGGIKKGSSATEMQLLAGVQTALTLTSTDITVPGTITMPSSGTGSPATTAKTVAAAITEVHDEVDTLSADLTPRINTLESSVSTLETNVSSLQTRMTSVEGRITNIEALNISSRLNALEADIQNIKLRLDILEI